MEPSARPGLKWKYGLRLARKRPRGLEDPELFRIYDVTSELAGDDGEQCRFRLILSSILAQIVEKFQ